MRAMLGLLLIVLGAWVPAGQAPSIAAAAFVDRYVALHAAGDVDGLLALHHEDAEFVIPGQDPVRGTAALRDLMEWDVALGSVVEMADVRLDGDAVVVDTIVERNRWFELLGVPEVRYRPGTRIVLRDRRIAGVHVSGFDADTQARVMDGFARMHAWLSEHRPADRDRLLPGGRFRYDAASARLWLEVLAAWRRASGA